MYWYNKYASKIIAKLFSKRDQQVFLNGYCSLWATVFGGAPQDSALSPLFFLICINDLTEDISSANKLFADDTSSFSIANDIGVSEHELNSDLRETSKWVYQ